MGHYWNQLYRLRFIKRWATSISVKPESVAEHSFYVAIAAYKLAELDEMLNGVKVDKEKLLVKALHHDVYETYTSHIVSPIKHHNDDTENVMKEIEKDYRERLQSLLPFESEKKELQVVNNVSNIDTYIDIADAIDGYCFSALQVYLGNKDFENKLILMRKRIIILSAQFNYVREFVEKLFDEKDFETVY